MVSVQNLLGTAVGTVLVVKILETGLRGTGMAYKFPEKKGKKPVQQAYSDRVFSDFSI